MGRCRRSSEVVVDPGIFGVNGRQQHEVETREWEGKGSREDMP